MRKREREMARIVIQPKKRANKEIYSDGVKQSGRHVKTSRICRIERAIQSYILDEVSLNAEYGIR